MHMAWPPVFPDQRDPSMVMPLFNSQAQLMFAGQSSRRAMSAGHHAINPLGAQAMQQHLSTLICALEPCQATNATVLPPISQAGATLDAGVGKTIDGQAMTQESASAARPMKAFQDHQRSWGTLLWDASLRTGNNLPTSMVHSKTVAGGRFTEATTPQACRAAQAEAQQALDHNLDDPVFTGVSKSGKHGRWRAQLCTGGRTIHLGTFSTQEEAARAWDQAVVAERGDKAHTNFDIKEYLDAPKSSRPSSTQAPKAAAQSKSSESSVEGTQLHDSTARKPTIPVKYKGIYQSGSPGKYKARLVINKRKVHLGTFSSAEEAAREWDRAAILHRGPNIKTNFDISEYAAIIEAQAVKSNSDVQDLSRTLSESESDNDNDDDEASAPVSTVGVKRAHVDLEKVDNGPSSCDDVQQQLRHKRSAPSEMVAPKFTEAEPESKAQSSGSSRQPTSPKSQTQGAQGEESTRASLMSLLALCNNAEPMDER